MDLVSVIIHKPGEDAAEDAGGQRFYGGIHFEDGDHHGRAMGGHFGPQTFQKATDYEAEPSPNVNAD